MAETHKDDHDPRRAVWTANDIRLEIARHLPLASVARLLLVDKASFNALCPVLWRHADLSAYYRLKGDLFMPHVSCLGSEISLTGEED
jgi:hypothetical protein